MRLQRLRFPVLFVAVLFPELQVRNLRLHKASRRLPHKHKLSPRIEDR